MVTIEEAAKVYFTLRDGCIHRQRDGKNLENNRPDSHGYIPLMFTVAGVRYTIKLHRLKFLLLHGWLPAIVDHRDGDTSHNEGTNLRAATAKQNSQNKRRRSGCPLPRGVIHHRKRRLTKPFQAQVRLDGHLTHLGYFQTPEEASVAVEAALAKAHGEFYRDPRKIESVPQRRN